MLEPPPPEAGSGMQRLAIALNFFFPSLAMVVLALRLYSKRTAKSLEPGTFRHPSTLLGPDDAFACAAMLVSIGLTISSHFYITVHNVGHQFPAPPEDMITGMVWTYVITVLYFPILGLIKSSILFFLLRLAGEKRNLRFVINGFNIFNMLGTIAITLTAINQCRPIRHFWDPAVEGTCINQPVFYLSQSGLNVLTDLITFAVPVFIFVRLRMARRTRIATLYVFFLGFIVTVVGIARFIIMYLLFYVDTSHIEHFTMSFCLSGIETNLAIVCACAPTLRGLARSLFPRRFPGGSGGGSGSHDPDHPDFFNDNDLKSPVTRDRDRDGGTTAAFGCYPKDMMGRSRVVSASRAAAGADAPVRLTPSEEEIVTAYNGILMTTDVVVEHDGSRSSRVEGATTTSTRSSSRTSEIPRGRRPDSMSLATDDFEGPRGRRRYSVSTFGSRRTRSRSRSGLRDDGSEESRRHPRLEEDDVGVGGWRPDGGGTPDTMGRRG
ncbi:hypothetical protein QBC39DRAFT_367476 [Podospora conica]|nr:hypothetical protein QBC39DRAFT_367476 [Schizothecium conicum]